MAMFVQGVCVGKKDENIEFTKDGKPDSFRSISASFSEPDGTGEPVSVDMDENQIKQFQPFQHYKFPVEARVVSTKRGAFCRISMLKSAVIERLGQAGASGQPAAKQG
ncbi:hypothetical protein C4J81_00345 [Deltaproteobacteria bacterium Smac51]|nr:hypothetical protein C4J81_00265 [Deltaproteobacteria bacterium Smac51]UQZ87748.1 hypothetical protein C4J81_00345 [Deltaproteobacteria bacterium Smac51]